jgi:hypothetical protein
MGDATQTTLQRHMAVVGRVIAKFVSDGLLPHDIDSRESQMFLGTKEDDQVFAWVLRWMLDEGIIRAREVVETLDGRMYISAAQLTAKGLSAVRAPVLGGETIEKQVQSAGGDNSNYSRIGELLGSMFGAAAKSMGSG